MLAAGEAAARAENGEQPLPRRCRPRVPPARRAATFGSGSSPSNCHGGYSQTVEPGSRVAISSPARRIASIFAGSIPSRTASQVAG